MMLCSWDNYFFVLLMIPITSKFMTLYHENWHILEELYWYKKFENSKLLERWKLLPHTFLKTLKAITQDIIKMITETFMVSKALSSG